MTADQSIIPSDSRYVPLTQQMYCCVPTCIQMVMHRHNIPLHSAELLGHHLGLIVDSDHAKYFWNVSTGDRPSSGYGTRISLPEYSLDSMFQKLNIPLKSNLQFINNFPTLKLFCDYLERTKVNAQDVLVCYDWPTLFDPTIADHWGHVCVLDKIDLNNGELRLIDPSPNSAKWVTVKIADMYRAMQIHGEKNSADRKSVV